MATLTNRCHGKAWDGSRKSKKPLLSRPHKSIGLPHTSQTRLIFSTCVFVFRGCFERRMQRPPEGKPSSTSSSSHHHTSSSFPFTSQLNMTRWEGCGTACRSTLIRPTTPWLPISNPDLKKIKIMLTFFQPAPRRDPCLTTANKAAQLAQLTSKTFRLFSSQHRPNKRR